MGETITVKRQAAENRARIERFQQQAGFKGKDAAFAVAIGVHPNTLFKWKTGKRIKITPIYWEKMERLARTAGFRPAV